MTNRLTLEEVIQELEGEVAAAREMEEQFAKKDTPKERLLRHRERIAYEACLELVQKVRVEPPRSADQDLDDQVLIAIAEQFNGLHGVSTEQLRKALPPGISDERLNAAVLRLQEKGLIRMGGVH